MIGWYVHHVGLGHTTRAAAVAAHLRHPVTGLGSGPAPAGWPGPWVRLPRDDGDLPGAVDPTAHDTLHWVPRHDAGLAHRQAAVAAWLAHERPALLVVDVSVEVALLARLCGVPTAVVVLPGDRTDRAHTLAHDQAELLLAPWPAGTHERQWPQRWRRRCRPVGALSRFDDRAPVPPPGPDASQRDRCVVVVGGAGGGAVSADLVRRAEAAAPGWRWSLRVPGSPGDLWADLQGADVVVTHGGQNAVAEVAAARRPAVVVAAPRPFAEQHATAVAVDRLGIAVGLDTWPEDHHWPALLDRALRLGGAGWQRWSTGHGARDAARLVDDLAETLTPKEHR